MLRIQLKPSLYLATVLTTAHFASAVVLIPLSMPLEAKLTIAGAIGVSLVHSVWRAALLRSRASLVAVELRKGGGIGVQTRDGRWHAARLLGTTYVTSQLTVLNLRMEGRRVARHVVLVPDTTDPDCFRRLRVLLRWRYGESPPEEQARSLPTA